MRSRLHHQSSMTVSSAWHHLDPKVKHTDMPNDMKTEVVDIIAGSALIELLVKQFACCFARAGSIDKFTLPTGVNFEGATRAIKADPRIHACAQAWVSRPAYQNRTGCLRQELRLQLALRHGQRVAQLHSVTNQLDRICVSIHASGSASMSQHKTER